MRNILFIFCFCFFGCAANLPKPPQFSLDSDARVGVFVEIKGKPTHSHIGTTAFSNYVQEYPLEWNIQTKAVDSLKEKFKGAGFQYVDLNEAGFDRNQLSHILVIKDGATLISPGKEEIINKLRNEMKLSAVVFFADIGRHVVAMECGGFGCTDQYADGYGLYSRSFLGINYFNAIPGFSIVVDIMNPPAIVSYSGAMEEYSKFKSGMIPLENFRDPKDFKSISAEEWLPVREAIEKRVDDLTAAIVTRLKSG